MERIMKKLLAIAAVTVGLSAAATTVANAQDYLVNGHTASKAEAQLLVSYGVQKGNRVVDGFGIASADSGHIKEATAANGGQKCWYVLDVQLCE
jgi:hypothetical protein